MKLNRHFSSVAVALMFILSICGGLVFASPPPQSDKPINTTVRAEKSVKNAVAVAIVSFDAAQAVARTAPTNYTIISQVPPVALPAETEQQITRRFYGYSITRNTGKIPIRPLNIKSIRRAEPAFVPLN